MRKYPLYKRNYYTRFRDFIDGLASGREDKPGISWFTRKGEQKDVTLGQWRQDIVCLQEQLIRQGLAGKHIAILGENSYEWLVAYCAITYCGAVAVCVDVEQSVETIGQMLGMADVEAIFCAASCKDICMELAGNEKTVICFADDETLPSVRSWIAEGEKIIAAGEADAKIDDTITGSNLASIVFTSGTTNYSKPVMLSQEAILINASDAVSNVAIGQRVFTSLPFYHTYGLTCAVFAMLIADGHLFINGNLKTVMRDIQLSKANTLLTVPLMLETIHNKMWASAEESGKANALRKLLKVRKFLLRLGIKKNFKALDRVREKCFGTLDMVICGGAHMNSTIIEQFYGLGLLVLQGYGITECAPLISVNRNKAFKFESVGLVSQHSQVKLVDGEIWVRGKNVMLGYYKHPELTEEAMDGEWFKTGDIGEIDKDGFLYITGRKKNLIVFKNGKKASPEKLEERIKRIPLVQDVVVYGAASGISSDDVQVAASVYPDPQAASGMDSYEILEALQAEISLINKELPTYQHIQMVDIREKEFSKTALQKIKRHLI